MTTPAELPALAVNRKTGAEPFLADGLRLGFDLLSFWQWAASEVRNNTLRGWLAEYLVAQALGVADKTRVEWDRCDLRSTSGLTIEVKSAAYLQSWAQKRPSSIKFDIAPKCGWDSVTNTYDPTARRQADIYVFALLGHRDKLTLDALNVDQWSFYVLGTAALNAVSLTQKSIVLSRLLGLKPATAQFATLSKAVDQVAASRQ